MVNLIYQEEENGPKLARSIHNREEYLALRNTPDNAKNFYDGRGGSDTAKARQIQFNYNDLLPDGILKGCCHPSSTFAHDIDCGSQEEQMRIKEVLLEKKDEIGLLELSGSARYGLHPICRRQPGKTIRECQYAVSMLTHTEYDTNARGLARVLYTGPATPDNLFYLDDAIFEESMSVENSEKEYELLKERESRGEEEIPAGAKRANKHYRPWEEENVSSRLSGSAWRDLSTKYDPEASYNGLLFKDIIGKYFELFNGGKQPSDGDRNAHTFELALMLRSICGYSHEKLQTVIPNYWMTPDGQCSEEDLIEYHQTIDNALKRAREGMPLRLKQVLNALRSQVSIQATGGTMTTPPPMPKRLPPLIRLLTKNVPSFYKPAVASAVFPALGVHVHGVKFRYWDNVEHEPTFMNVLIGRQSIGKGTIKAPINYIMEDIRLKDMPNRQRESEWKQNNPGAKPKKDARPTDICIQMLIDNLTDAIFNQRVIDANTNGGRFIFLSVDEIEGLKKVTSKGTADEVGLLIRKAYDNSMVGQERYGADSVSGIAPLRWNFNASTTPPNARKFFYKMVNDGTVSRLDISTIIKDDDDDDDESTAPILGIYDHTFAEELKPYLERLEAANGLIECHQAKKLSLEMKKENSDAAKLYESEAYRVFSYRANVIAWLKGMVLYVAHGYKWSKEIADFVRWSQQYNLWCKMLYFGKQLEKELREELEIQSQSGPQNLLDLLPDEFTKDQYFQLRQSLGRSGSGESTLRVWQSRKYIQYSNVSGAYCKTESYLLKHPSDILNK